VVRDEGNGTKVIRENTRDPTGEPNWIEVPSDRCKALPFAAIGLVRVVRNGTELERGTCWLASPNAAVTAAHVVARWREPGVTVHVDFPDPKETVKVSEISIPMGYGNATGAYDPFDMALLRLPSGQRPNLDRQPVDVSTVRVIGYPFTEGATLMESAGDGVMPDSVLLLHSADTAAGHSGAPVFGTLGGPMASVIGLHISGFNGNPYKVQYPRYNVALTLRPELQAFILQHANAWG